MAYTTAQRDALKAAIASGTTRVSYDGKSIEYRSIAEIKEILRLIDGELGTTVPVRRVLLSSRRGL